MADADPLLGHYADSGAEPPRYALSAVVYAERGDDILLLKRAKGSALAGQWFLPGGMVERDELPEAGARRELREEAGVEIDGDLELIGAYPMYVYGYDTLQLSYRGTVGAGADVAISGEHVGARWVKPTDMRAVLTDEVIDQIADGGDRVRTILRFIRTDLDLYIARVSEPQPR